MEPDFFFSWPASCFANCLAAQYFDAPSEQCQACDPQCATCFGPSQSECLSCAPGRRLEINVCTRCEDTPGLQTNQFDETVCDEVCGDGLFLELTDCEDGNLADGDGCS